MRGDQRGYVIRAREGAVRLQSILSALGAASPRRGEHPASRAREFRSRGALACGRGGLSRRVPECAVQLDVPADALSSFGAPELIAQMLDKLVENAVDFTPPGGAITVRLGRAGGRYELSVENDGPPIPDAMLGRLFESLFEHRQGQRRQAALRPRPVHRAADRGISRRQRARRQSSGRRRRSVQSLLADDLKKAAALAATALPQPVVRGSVPPPRSCRSHSGAHARAASACARYLRQIR